ncbi:MAG: YHS domain-containing protein [Dehalococcoidia bacterium]
MTAETGLPLVGTPRRAIKTTKVRARGEDFRIVQVQGNLLVCAVQNCCCGHTEKGRPPVPMDRYDQEWNARRFANRVHLTFTGCLGPCAAGNNALLVILGRSIWFKDLNDDALIPAIFDYIEAMLAAEAVLPPPETLREHVYERFLPPPSDAFVPLVVVEDDGGGLERIDPVCLMDVDPATAKWSVVHNGRTIYFCAPACKRAFERDPEQYAIA